MMRKPACSIMALTAPVRLRAVASGLMIENVRSIDICDFRCSEVAGTFSIAAAYSVERIQRQGGLRGLAAWTGFVDWPGRIDPIDRAGPAPLPHASQTPKAMRPKRILTVAEDAAQLTLIHSRTNKSGPNFQQNR
jgi:hypothetical protein